ncbi:MAG: hypothetical protein DRP45_07260 [Candidatus Zixiibacteriota bacterium]|nr:MAG: hypothetical protein DRP45_07260 [candidate division Zixibacteria bacterium]
MYRQAIFALSILATIILFIACTTSESDDQSLTTRTQGTTTAQETTQPQSASAQTTTSTAVGGPTGVIAYDIAGKQHQMSEWLGKQPLVVNFWGTWCPPCRREIPDLVRLYNEYRSRGVEMIGLAVKDSPSKVRNYASSNGMEWVMLMGDQSHIGPFGLKGSVPTTIFYDRNGNEVERFVGSRPYDVFKEAFEKIAN